MSISKANISERWAYRLKEGAKIVGLSEATLRREAARGKIRLLKCRGRTLVSADDLRSLIETAA
jgi:hypothetical protein